MLTFANISNRMLLHNFFLDKIVFMRFKEGRMVEVKDEVQEETMREVGHFIRG